MKGTMRGVTLHAEWQPKPGFKLGAKDIDRKQTYLGSKVWKNPKVSIDEHAIPEPKDDEVLIEMKAVGICGSDVHMNQATDDGYIFYPGLTGFPTIIGHEVSGVVVKGGKSAFDKRTMKPFKGASRSAPRRWSGAPSAARARTAFPTTARSSTRSAST